MVRVQENNTHMEVYQRRMNNVVIYVKGNKTDFMLDLDAEPDYLMGHLACMEIDSEYGVECGGING